VSSYPPRRSSRKITIIWFVKGSFRNQLFEGYPRTPISGRENTFSP
jgi:hypothetical protein